MLIRVVTVQAGLGEPLSLEDKIHIFRQRPDFVCLSEFCTFDDSVTDYQRAALRRNEFIEYFEKLSYQLSTCLISGSLVEAEAGFLYNCCYVFNRGTLVGRYRKQHLTDGEQKAGISPGYEKLLIEVEGVKVGVLICADVFRPELFSRYLDDHVDLTFIPTTSLLRPDDSVSQKHYRDQKYFVAGANLSGSYVVKACGVGSIFGKPLQGRSLVAAPWGVVARVDFGREDQKQILSVTLDIAELREFRSRLHAVGSGKRAMNVE